MTTKTATLAFQLFPDVELGRGLLRLQILDMHLVDLEPQLGCSVIVRAHFDTLAQNEQEKFFVL